MIDFHHQGVTKQNKTFRFGALLSKTGRGSFILLVYFFICFCSRSTFAANNDTSSGVTIIRQPEQTYYITDEIIYEISIRWDSKLNESRMSSPRMNLENLVFVGARQSTQSTSGTGAPPEQIFQFSFKGNQTGRAAIRKLELEFFSGQGAEVTRFQIPPVELEIKSDFSLIIRTIFIAIAGIIVIFSSIMLFRKKFYRKPAASKTTPEEDICGQLARLKIELTSAQKPDRILKYLVSVTEDYLLKKLDWKARRDSYNLLKSKAAETWSKKEAQTWHDFMKKLEDYRYSGKTCGREEINELLNTINSFIRTERSL